jgi:hypothetical protein
VLVVLALAGCVETVPHVSFGPLRDPLSRFDVVATRFVHRHGAVVDRDHGTITVPTRRCGSASMVIRFYREGWVDVALAGDDAASCFHTSDEGYALGRGARNEYVECVRTVGEAIGEPIR